jgi:hypothetical protein
MHALVYCGHARQFCCAASEVLFLKLPKLHPVTWTRDILCDPRFTPEVRARIITVMYNIWTSRNNITHGKGGYNPSKTMEVIQDTLQFLELPKQKVQRGLHEPCKWTSPIQGIVKINFDGAICEIDSRAVSGVVARDHNTSIGATTKVYEGVLEPLIVEALAARDACVYDVKRGFDRVVLVTDCQVLMKHWVERKIDRSVIRTILDEISELMSSFSSFHILYEGREANQVAHCYAKFAVVNGEHATWDTEPPPWLIHSLMADCNEV